MFFIKMELQEQLNSKIRNFIAKINQYFQGFKAFALSPFLWCYKNTLNMNKFT